MAEQQQKPKFQYGPVFLSPSSLPHHCRRPLLNRAAATAESRRIQNSCRLSIESSASSITYSESLPLLYVNRKATHKMYKGSNIKHECLIATLSDGDKGELLRIECRIQDYSAIIRRKASDLMVTFPYNTRSRSQRLSN